LEKTGILYLDSKPKEANIYINGKYKDTTPSRLTKFLPDKYDVEISKNGYYPWVKEVEIKSNLTTFYKDVVLFKKGLPQIKVVGEVNIMTISPDQQKIIYSLIKNNEEELRFLNLKTNSDLLVEKFNLKTYNYLQFSSWSPNQNKALIKQVIGDFNKYLIVDIETLKVKELFDITRLNFNTVVWDVENDSYLYGLRKTVLHQIDLLKNSIEPILSDNISDFEVVNRTIYYITRIANDYFLNQKLPSGESENKRIKLPSFSNYTLQPSPPHLITLLDQNNNDLFIINSEAFDSPKIEEQIILQAKAKNIFWSKDFKNLIYYTDFELWTYDFDRGQGELLTRYGQVINEAIWYPTNKYIIYQLNGAVKTTEAKPETIKNDLTLARLEKIEKIVIDGKGENLYFAGKIGNQQGIFQLELQ